jgi:biotin carboxylase
MDKTLLIVSGSVQAAAAAQRAKEMGLYVVVSDRNPQAPGFAFADSCIIADVYGPDESAAAAMRFSRKLRKIDGVICVAADAPMTVAAINERLGLPGISRKSAAMACDKLAMKAQFLAAGVPVPWFAEVATPQALTRVAIERGRNLVIKPVDSRGSRGVQRVAQVEDLDQAFMLARDQSPSERVMVEEFLSGPQISTESVVVNGTCYTPGFSDRNYEYMDRYAPYFIENGGDLPSHLSPELQDKVKDVVARAAAALGITNGTVKGDIVVHKGEPHIIELAARLSGGYFCTREIPLNTGVDFIGAAINIALGENVSAADVTPKFTKPVVQRYAFPTPGRITRISGEDEARRIAGVEDFVVSAKPGDIIPPPTNSGCSAAMVLASGVTKNDALDAANAALEALVIETEAA